MLAYLARQREHTAPRARLAALIWATPGGRHALRQTLLALRGALGRDAAAVLQAEPDTVRLAPALAIDIARFDALLAGGALDAACALLRGRFCEGLDLGAEPFEDWLAQERARLDERAAGALAALAVQAEAEGRLDAALAAAERLVSLDPLSDGAQARLIALYRRRGWSDAARLAHRRCVGLFHRELGIAPSAAVQAAARAPLPPAPSAAASAAARAWPRWRAAAAAVCGLVAAGLIAADRPGLAPKPATAAPAAAWVSAEEWRPDAAIETGGVPLPAAIARALAGDPDFAHLYPAGC